MKNKWTSEGDPKGDPGLLIGPDAPMPKVGEYPGVAYDADNDVLASGKTTDVELSKEAQYKESVSKENAIDYQVSDSMMRAAALESANKLSLGNTADLLQAANDICTWLRTGVPGAAPDSATATADSGTAT